MDAPTYFLRMACWTDKFIKLLTPSSDVQYQTVGRWLLAASTFDCLLPVVELYAPLPLPAASRCVVRTTRIFIVKSVCRFQSLKSLVTVFIVLPSACLMQRQYIYKPRVFLTVGWFVVLAVLCAACSRFSVRVCVLPIYKLRDLKLFLPYLLCVAVGSTPWFHLERLELFVGSSQLQQ